MIDFMVDSNSKIADLVAAAKVVSSLNNTLFSALTSKVRALLLVLDPRDHCFIMPALLDMPSIGAELRDIVHFDTINVHDIVLDATNGNKYEIEDLSLEDLTNLTVYLAKLVKDSI